MDTRELDPYDFDAAAHAYEAIRQTHDDVAAIARHTGMRESWITRIKLTFPLHDFSLCSCDILLSTP
jgi:hypothetical protein